MKKLENKLNYYAKGELVGMTEGLVKTVVHKKNEDVEDTIDMADLYEELEELCSKNQGKEISISFVAKVSE